MGLELLAQCPSFDLPGTDGRTHSLVDATSKILVVLAWCNHCPYVVAYESRVVALAKSYESHEVQFLAVNANDATRYPDDGMQAMKARARERGFPFPYVRDNSQALLRVLGAQSTPEAFVFDEDRKLRYRGRIDDNHRAIAQVTAHHLKNALDALLLGKAPPVTDTTAFGCSIKWK